VRARQNVTEFHSPGRRRATLFNINVTDEVHLDAFTPGIVDAICRSQ